MLEDVKRELRTKANPEKAVFFPRFFKAGPGEYAEGDKFLGVTVPEQRLISKQFYQRVSVEDALELLKGGWHEERLTALFILVLKFQKGDEVTKKDIVHAYLKNTQYVSNWDLVDSSAPYILGNWLLNKDREILYSLAKSELLWERRIAIIATLEFIRKGEFGDTLLLAEQLLGDREDLMHKAVGWSLREVGKKDRDLLIAFLDKHAAHMPRTALRYSIEHFDANNRRHYLEMKS